MYVVFVTSIVRAENWDGRHFGGDPFSRFPGSSRANS